MSKILSAALLMCLVALLSTLLTPAVLATKPELVTGKLDYHPHPIPPVPAKMADGSVSLNTWEEGVWFIYYTVFPPKNSEHNHQ